MEYKRKSTALINHQSPNPVLQVYFPGKTEAPDIIFASDITGKYTNLTGYSFSESVEDLSGSFQFSVENAETDKNGTSIFDLIPLRSVVKIFEGKEYPEFVGIVRKRHTGKSMTGSGVKKTTVFSGTSVSGCVSEYKISLDMRIQDVSNAMSKSKDLTDKLSKIPNPEIKTIMIEIWKHFEEISNASGISTTGVANIIEGFMGGPDSFIETGKNNPQFKYNIAISFYNETDNIISDSWRKLLPSPVYEIFSTCINGKPKIYARQQPFGYEENAYADWKNLDIYKISPVSLISYELDQSDTDVYTAFVSYIIGSAMDRKFYMATNQSGKDSIVEHDIDKQKLYGFRPLEVNFIGYDKQGNARNEDADTLKKSLQSLNKMLKYWYARVDEMYSGNITVCTNFNETDTNPKIGCRLGFLGGEFYITSVTHSWNYGGVPMIRLSVSRGLKYDSAGKIEGSLKNIGAVFAELKGVV